MLTYDILCCFPVVLCMVFFPLTFLFEYACIIDQEAKSAGDVNEENSIIFQLRIYFLFLLF